MSRWGEDASLSPVAVPLFDYLTAHGKTWKGTPEQLLELLRAATSRDKWWTLPGTASELAEALERLRYRLLAFGVGYSPRSFDGWTAIEFRELDEATKAKLRRGREAWKRRQRYGAA